MVRRQSFFPLTVIQFFWQALPHRAMCRLFCLILTEMVHMIQFTVSFDTNGGTGEMNPINCMSEGVIGLPANTFSAPEGMKFKGWSETADGDVIISTEYEVTKNVTLYAI